MATAEPPQNVILFLGDGMGVSTVTAARILAGQRAGKLGEEHELSFETFPNVALVKTYNTDSQVADSAGTMSAIMTGEKTRIGIFGVNASVSLNDCAGALANELPTLLEDAEDRRPSDRHRLHRTNHPRDASRHLRPHAEPRLGSRRRDAADQRPKRAAKIWRCR